MPVSLQFFSAIVPLKATHVVAEDDNSEEGPAGPAGSAGDAGQTDPSVDFYYIINMAYLYNTKTNPYNLNLIFEVHWHVLTIGHRCGEAESLQVCPDPSLQG